MKDSEKLTEYQPERTSVWSFPDRGSWATHSSGYRGNFAPQVARNVIEMYSEPGDFILDPMVGSGTTLIEAKLLNRNALGIDINPEAVEMANKALNFAYRSHCNQKAIIGNARNLDIIKDNSVDLILTHPPYLNIIKYSNGKITGDLSNISNLNKFCDEIEIIAQELFRVLKPGRYCAILIGDTRKRQHYVPLSYYVMERFLKSGFILREDIIKIQHNCAGSRGWGGMAGKYKFYLIMHEHLFVFRKPGLNEDTSHLKYSMYLGSKL